MQESEKRGLAQTNRQLVFLRTLSLPSDLKPAGSRTENRPHRSGRLPIQVWSDQDGQGYVPERTALEWLRRREAPMSAATPEPMCGARVSLDNTSPR
jgi:hypothetical protein